MSTECEGKGSWPELVGVAGNVAVATIERENPLVNAMTLPPRVFPITDYRCDRVWVYVDANGISLLRFPSLVRLARWLSSTHDSHHQHHIFPVGISFNHSYVELFSIKNVSVIFIVRINVKDYGVLAIVLQFSVVD